MYAQIAALLLFVSLLAQSAAGGTIRLVDEIQQTVAVRRSKPEGREAFRLLMDAEIEFFEKSLRVQQPGDSGE